MATANSLSIVVPCYNEEKNIPLIVGRFTEALQKYKGRAKIEIILVDNGSKDRSSEGMASEFARVGRSEFRTVLVPVNQGYGFGILSGLKAATSDVLAWTHADMQTDPYDVFLAFDLFERTLPTVATPAALMVKGRRIGRKFGDWAFTLGMSVISSVILGKLLFDINAQPKLFHRELYDSLLDPPHDFSLDLYLVYTAKLRHIRLETIDVRFAPRIHGESKWAFSWKSKYKTILRTIRYIVALRDQLSHVKGTP